MTQSMPQSPAYGKGAVAVAKSSVRERDLPLKDVKTYIKIQPLPISQQHGIKMQARNARTDTMATPTRDEIRHENYIRRHQQMTSKGYLTPSHKPYESIGGEPVLDEEELVKCAMGQENIPLVEEDSRFKDKWNTISQSILTMSATVRGMRPPATPLVNVESDQKDSKLSSQEYLKIMKSTGIASSTPSVFPEEIMGKIRSTIVKQQQSPAPQKSVVREKIDHTLLQKTVKEGRNNISASKLGRSMFHRMEIEESQKRLAAHVASKKPYQMDKMTDSDASSVEELEFDLISMFDPTYSESYLGASRPTTTFSCFLPTYKHAPSKESKTQQSTRGFRPHTTQAIVRNGSKTQTKQVPLKSSGSRNRTEVGGKHYDRQQRKSSFCSELSGEDEVEEELKMLRADSISKPQEDYDMTEFAWKEDESCEADDEYDRRSELSNVVDEIYNQDESLSINRGVSEQAHIVRRKKQLPLPRAFTPKTNISELNFKQDEIRGPMFRQLCPLLWILNSLTFDPPWTVSPLATCWNLKSLGGEKIYRSRVQKEKLNETKWEHFVSHANPAKGSKRVSKQGRQFSSKMSRLRQGGTVTGSARRTSSQSHVSSESRNRSASSTKSITPREEEGQQTIDIQKAGGVLRESEEEGELAPLALSANHNQLLGRRQSSMASSAQSTKETISMEPVAEASGPALVNQGKEDSQPTIDINPKKGRSITSHPSDYDEDIQKYVKMALGKQYLWKFSTKSMKEEDYGTSSEKYKELPARLKRDFQQSTDESALTLRDAIAKSERMRSDMSHAKYNAFHQTLRSGSRSDFYRDLDIMRSVSEGVSKAYQPKDKYTKWYTELRLNLPESICSDKYGKFIVEKLEFYGTIGNIESRKITTDAMTSLLSTLRPWEMCNPDVRAAIEFVREKIVGMTELEFFEWFASHAPDYAAIEIDSSQRLISALS